MTSPLTIHDDPRSTGAQCRLCQGETVYRFGRNVLRKYDVGFYECQSCGSLQTEQPYWLNESYADQRRVLDVGGLARIERLRVITIILLRVLGFKAGTRLLDWGAGDGLFVRMLRDDGIDAYHWDAYCQNVYAVGFEGDALGRYDFITCFEVFEHLPNPAVELAELFKCCPHAILATTSIYKRQGPEWDYLNTLTGRHVFFYSRRAISLIAKTYGYDYRIFLGFILFSRSNLSKLLVLLISLLTKACSKPGLMRLLHIVLPKKSLTPSDLNVVRTAVSNGHLWPDPEHRHLANPRK